MVKDSVLGGVALAVGITAGWVARVSLLWRSAQVPVHFRSLRMGGSSSCETTLPARQRCLYEIQSHQWGQGPDVEPECTLHQRVF